MLAVFRVALVAALSLLVLPQPSRADYVVKDGNGASATFGSFSLSGVNFPKHALADPSTGAAIGVSSSPLFVQISGTPTVTVGNFPATQAISAASLPLPTGAATAAKQPALGTAGAPSADVLTVQGAASMTALKVDGSAVTQPISAAALPLPSGAATATAQATGNTSLASIDGKMPAPVNGRQPVDGSGVTQPVSLPAGAQTTSGALQPPTAGSGKITQTSTALSVNTSTQLVAANANRIAVEIQCDGTAVVGIDRTGGTLTSATAAGLVVPTGSYPLYTMPIATQTAITAYTGTAQTCRTTEYLR